MKGLGRRPLGSDFVPEDKIKNEKVNAEEEITQGIETESEDIDLEWLISKVVTYCEKQAGVDLYPYQREFAERIVESIIINDGEELSALFSRQSGKTETIAIIMSGIMVILPRLAQIPQFEKYLGQFKNGLWIGLFAPSGEQAFTTFSRTRDRIRSKNAKLILNDPEINTTLDKESNPMMLSNGSLLRMHSAAKQAQIESKTYHILIIEEAQDVDQMKLLKCLPGDTRILTSAGYAPLEKVVKDQMKDVAYFNDMETFSFATPYEYYDNGEQGIYQIKLRGGNIIEATLNHQFYTRTRIGNRQPKWSTVEEIMCSNSLTQIAVPDSLPLFGTVGTYDEGLLLGYMLGDGCTAGRTPLFIGDEPTIERFKELYGNKVNINTYTKNDNGMLEVGLTTPGTKQGDNWVTETLKKYEVFGLIEENKKLPDNLLTKEFYQGLIEGLIETDGSVECPESKPIISFANISETLINQLQDILLKFGIHTAKYSRTNNQGFGKDKAKTLYLLHIKGVKDIQRFGENITLYTKQEKLMKALKTISGKQDRRSGTGKRGYSENIRFYGIDSISYVGKKHTYCLSMPDRNFIANNIISSNSIHPMGASTNATIIKIGTPNNKRCEFLAAINRNKTNDLKRRGRRNHFQFDYKVCQKYNPRYRKYIEKEKLRYGEDSDFFRMSYRLEWILERGMFMSEEMMTDIFDKSLQHKLQSNLYCAAGIDCGKRNDSTIVTIAEVDNTHLEEDRVSGDMKARKQVINWLELQGDDYESQYYQIIDFLKSYNVKCIFVDSTGVGTPIADRLIYGFEGVAEVVPYDFTTSSKSEMWKSLQGEIRTRRLTVCGHAKTRSLRTWKNFHQQMEMLEKDYKGQHMVCAHPEDIKDAHDDYCDSLALCNLACDYDALPEIEISDNFAIQRSR